MAVGDGLVPSILVPLLRPAADGFHGDAVVVLTACA